ncbi:MAG: FeS cluster assembly protein SufD [Gammaproteobacteria bacterium]|nr:FeS cluster assembly protein SufD [Gammaproteobacteria bacterium]
MSERFEQLLAERSRLDLPGAGVDWVETIRNENARRFEELGLPTPRDEDWKYTNIEPIARKSFTPADTGESLTGRDLRAIAIPGLDVHRAILIDGHYSPTLSNAGELGDGVRICSLAEAIDEQPDLVQPWLGRLAAEPEHGFRALNSAFLQDGIFIWVPDGCRIDTPIELCCVQHGEPEETVSQPRHLVVAGEGSRLTLIERYVSLHDKRYLTNAITEVFARRNARVDHYKLQQESTKGYHIGSWLIEQHAGSHVMTHNAALGGATARTDIRVRLDGAHAHCDLNGVYVLNGRQHVDTHTKVDHCVADTSSDEFYKGVLNDRSRAVFHGRVVVHPDAQRSDARQRNKNLLLSPDAEVDSKPQLEIHADDVACTHGASVGQLDDDALFYLRTRGVDEETARGLLTFAFANDVIEKFELPRLRHYVEHELTSKMFSIDDLEEII